MQRALDRAWRYTGELFEGDDLEARLVAQGIAVDSAAPRAAWDAQLDEVLALATLARPTETHMQRGGRGGRHTEHLGHLLAEMQIVARSHPGAKW